jgi:hypothetical protein
MGAMIIIIVFAALPSTNCCWVQVLFECDLVFLVGGGKK